MTKAKKRLLTLLLALLMAVGMAVPTFALEAHHGSFMADESGYTGYNYLNVNGTPHSALKNRTIGLYHVQLENPLGDDQVVYMTPRTYNGNTGYLLGFYGYNGAYAINRRNSDGRAFMWDVATGIEDSLFTPFDGDGRMWLMVGNHKDYCLTWSNNSPGAAVNIGPGHPSWLITYY